MAFTHTWNAAFESAPADTENVSQGAGRIRDLKAAISERMAVAHSWAGDANDGKLLDSAITTVIESVYGLVSGTDMLFVQSAAPTGWTQVTALNDRVLRLVSGTGGGTGGSWTISGISVDGHTLTLAEIPAHDHPATAIMGSEDQDSFAGTLTDSADSAINVKGTSGSHVSIGSRGGGGSHTHGLTIGSSWRPSYVDVIQASKD